MKEVVTLQHSPELVLALRNSLTQPSNVPLTAATVSDNHIVTAATMSSLSDKILAEFKTYEKFVGGGNISIGIVQALINKIRRAELYLWDYDIARAAVVGAECFVGVKAALNESMPPVQFWIPDVDWVYKGRYCRILNLPDGVSLYGKLVEVSYKRNLFALDVYYLPDSESKFFIRPRGHVSAGEPCPDSAIETLAMYRFMNSKIVTPAKVDPDRAERRRLQKAGVTPSVVNVIRLRRNETWTHAGESGSVDWHHRWIVRGHWRNQWHPSTGEHSPIFVDSHIKGPEDKPLLPPRQSLYVVNR